MVLLQSGKQAGLSGSISGGAETFFGKEKGKTLDKLFSKLTTIVAIIFTLLVIIVYVIQPDTVYDPSEAFGEQFNTAGDAAVETTAAADEAAETTVAVAAEAAE